MSLKPTYAELLQKVKALEEENRAWMENSSVGARDCQIGDSGSVQRHIDSLENADSLGSIRNRNSRPKTGCKQATGK